MAVQVETNAENTWGLKGTETAMDWGTERSWDCSPSPKSGLGGLRDWTGLCKPYSGHSRIILQCWNSYWKPAWTTWAWSYSLTWPQDCCNNDRHTDSIFNISMPLLSLEINLCSKGKENDRQIGCITYIWVKQRKCEKVEKKRQQERKCKEVFQLYWNAIS